MGSVGLAAAFMPTIATSTSPSFSYEYSSTGDYTITLTVSDGAGDAATSSWSGLQTEGTEFMPYPPTRILDTRKGIGAFGPVGPKGTLELQVGNPPIPEPDGIMAVVLNATVTEPTGNGYLALYPYDPNNPNALPSTSNLNYLTGQTVPNLAIVPIGTVPDDSFQPPLYEYGIYLGGHGSADVILDLFGYFANS